jgi:CRP/FNR family transcriptional regulator
MHLSGLLKETTLFSDLSNSDIRDLVNLGGSRKYRVGEWLVCQGEIWPNLIFMISGEITALKESPEGRSLILETFREGEIFWGLAFFLDDAPMPAALRASKESSILVWNRNDLTPLLIRDGRISWELSRLALQRALRASAIVDELAFQPVAGRLANFLVDRFPGSQGERIARDLTLDEIAAHVGSTREMVCRILQRFANQGLIDITRTEFVFTDREGLNRLAQNVSE